MYCEKVWMDTLVNFLCIFLFIGVIIKSIMANKEMMDAFTVFA